MKVRKEAQRIARQLFRSSAPGGVLDEARARAYATAILEKKPRGYLGILEAFSNLIRLDVEGRHAVVESATQLDGPMQEQVGSKLRDSYGANITVEFRVTPELLGGMRVKMGDDVWDGSVKARLEQLEEAFV